MNHFKKQQIQNIADFNPREQLAKGVLAKSVPMAMLKEFQRQIMGYEIKAFNGGAKFRNTGVSAPPTRRGRSRVPGSFPHLQAATASAPAPPVRASRARDIALG